MVDKQQWIAIDGKRYNLASMVDLGISGKHYGTGITLEHVYLMPRSKKLIVESSSIWEDPRTHGCIGRKYYIVDPEQDSVMIASFANMSTGENRQRLLDLLSDGGN